MGLPIIHHPDYRLSLTRTGTNDLSKYGAIMDAVLAAGLVASGNWLEPRPVSVDDLLTAHSADWTHKVLDGQLTREEERRIGLIGDDILERRIRISIGGTILAARVALDQGIALNTAGGSHHAHREFGSGYCVFNDVAVAAGVMLREQAAQRILVIDLDVHQGDGTATIFRGDERVFTFSMHCDRNFPHRKSVSDLDIAMPEDIDDEGYMYLLERQMDRLFETVRPDLVFYNAGVDIHEGDKLGNLKVSRDGIRQRDTEVISTSKRHDAPLVVVPGGGYGEDMNEVADRHLIVFEAAAEIFAADAKGHPGRRRI